MLRTQGEGEGAICSGLWKPRTAPHPADQEVRGVVRGVAVLPPSRGSPGDLGERGGRCETARYFFPILKENVVLCDVCTRPEDILEDASLRLNGVYYITKLILPALNRAFSLLGVDVWQW